MVDRRFRAFLFMLMFVSAVSLSVTAADEEGGDVPPDRKLFDQATRLLQMYEPSEARPVFEQFVESYPDSKLLPQALARAGECQPLTPEGRAKAMAYWRRLHKEFGEHQAAQSVVGRIEQVGGFTFSKMPEWATPKQTEKLSVSRYVSEPVGPTLKSRYVVHEVPGALAIKALSDLEWANTDGDAWKSIERTHWRRANVVTQSFSPSHYEEAPTIAESSFNRHEPHQVRKDLALGGMRPGYYVIEEFVDDFRKLHYLEVSSFGVVSMAGPRRAAVWVFDPETGKGIADAPVEFTLGDSDAETGKAPTTLGGRTDAQGLARFDLPMRDGDGGRYRVTVGRKNQTGQERVVIGQRLSLREDELVEALVHLSTDRPVYRPGHTVHYKIVRRNRGDELSLPVDEDVSVEVRDPKGRVLDQKTLRWNEHGSVSGSFELAATPPLGEYHVVARVRIPDTVDTSTLATAAERSSTTLFGGGEFFGEPFAGYWSQSFKVEAYRKPEFTVEFNVDDTAVGRDGGFAIVEVKGEYYFGGPVAGAKVELTGQRRVRRTRGSIFRSRGGSSEDDEEAWPRLPVDDPLAWLYETAVANETFWARSRDAGWWDVAGQEIHRSAETDAQGVARIRVPIRPPDDKRTYYAFLAEVRDAAGFTVSAEGRLSLNEPAYEVAVGFDRLFYLPEQKITATAKVTTRSGEPAANVAVELIAMHSDSTSDFKPLPRGRALKAIAQKGNDLGWSGQLDQRRPATGIEFEPLFKRTVKTDAHGVARLPFDCETHGRVRIVARVVQRSGDSPPPGLPLKGEGIGTEDRTDVLVVGESAAKKRGPWDSDLYMLTQQAAYQAGEPVKLLVVSGVKLEQALITFENSDVRDAKIVTINKGVNLIDLPTRGSFTPNVVLHLFGWRDGRQYWGATQVYLAPWDASLDVQVKTDRDSYGPREKMTVTIETRSGDAPAPAEVELLIVDESVFDIEKDETADIRQRFYAPRYDYVNAYGSLPVFDAELGTGQVSFGGSSGGPAQATTTLFGEASPEFDLNSAMSNTSAGGELAPPAFTRSNFADTMHYAAHVTTDAQGKATAEIDTPDNLTRWRIVARAVSGAQSFGTARSETLTRKDVLVRLSTPRFYNERDAGEVVTIVHNNRDEAAPFRVSLDSRGAAVWRRGEGDQLIDAREPLSLTVAAHGSAKVRWLLKPAVDASEIQLEAKALSTGESDAVGKVIPVQPFAAMLHEMASGAIGAQWKQTLTLPADARAKSASLLITVTTPGVDAARDALPFLAGYPYGCVEQTMSRFLPALVAHDAMKRHGLQHDKLAEELPRMVNAGLQRLYHFQGEFGAWAWWGGDGGGDRRMTAYVVIGLSKAKLAGFDVDEPTLAHGLTWLRDLRQPKPYEMYARSLARKALADWKPAERESNSLLDALFKADDDGVAPDGAVEDKFDEQLAAMQPADDAVEDIAYLVLAGRADLIEKLPAAPDWRATPSTVTRASLVLQALLSVKADAALTEPFVDWLMRQRRGSRWFSTLDTAWAVMALSQLHTSGEPAELTVLLNGEAISLRDRRAQVAHEKLKPGDNVIEITHGGKQKLYASAVLSYHAERDAFEPVATPFKVEREFQRQGEFGIWTAIESNDVVRPGELIRVKVLVTGPGAEHVLIESPTPAGAEASVDQPGEEPERWRYHWRDDRQVRDDRVTVAIDLFGGRDGAFYFLRPTHPGEYRVLPTRMFAMYEPSRQGSSASFVFKVEAEEGEKKQAAR